MKLTDLPSNFRGAEVLNVIHVQAYEGHGTPESVGRIVHYYLDIEGNLLAKYDPHPEDK